MRAGCFNVSTCPLPTYLNIRRRLWGGAATRCWLDARHDRACHCRRLSLATLPTVVTVFFGNFLLSNVSKMLHAHPSAQHLQSTRDALPVACCQALVVLQKWTTRPGAPGIMMSILTYQPQQMRQCHGPQTIDAPHFWASGTVRDSARSCFLDAAFHKIPNTRVVVGCATLCSMAVRTQWTPSLLFTGNEMAMDAVDAAIRTHGRLAFAHSASACLFL